MKSMYGKITEAMLTLILCLCTILTASAQSAAIEFRLTADECGFEKINATMGEAVLSASADGVNAEKIRWDTDPERLYPRMQGKNLASGWHEGGYWLIEFSGSEKKNMKLSADMYSTKKGPRDWKIYYSTDGKEFAEIENSAVALDNDPMTAYKEFPLPNAIDGAEKIYIKITMCSDISVGGSKITGVKDGSTYINNIIISYDGEAAPAPSTPAPTQKPEKIYYESRENRDAARLGKPTGKYCFTVDVQK